MASDAAPPDEPPRPRAAGDGPPPAAPSSPASSSAVSARQGGRVAVVLNGNARSVTQEVIETIDQILDAGDLFVSRRVEESEGIARALVDRGYDTILTGGGDGTFTVVVSAVVHEAKRRGARVPRFGLLRLGTGNGLAWVIGAGTSRGVERSLALDVQRLRTEAGSRALRLLDVDGLMSPFAGFGVDAVMLRDYHAVLEKLGKGPVRRWLAGTRAYALAAVTRTLPAYLVKKPMHVRITNQGSDAVRVGDRGRILGAPLRRGAVLYEGPASVVGAGTIPFYGFGFRMFPYADERADRMQVRVSTIDALTFVRHFADIYAGHYEDLERVFDYLCDDVLIEVDPASPFQIGGDTRGERSSARVRLAEPIELVDFYAPPRGARSG